MCGMPPAASHRLPSRGLPPCRRLACPLPLNPRLARRKSKRHTKSMLELTPTHVPPGRQAKARPCADQRDSFRPYCPLYASGSLSEKVDRGVKKYFHHDDGTVSHRPVLSQK